MCLSVGTPTSINFPVVLDGKLMAPDVPKFKQIKAIINIVLIRS